MTLCCILFAPGNNSPGRLETSGKFFGSFDIFLSSELSFDFFGSLLVTQPIVHSGEAIRGRFYGCGRCHWLKVTGDMVSVT